MVNSRFKLRAALVIAATTGLVGIASVAAMWLRAPQTAAPPPVQRAAVPWDHSADDSNDFVSGDAVRLTPLPYAQIRDASCSNGGWTALTRATVGPSKMAITFKVERNSQPPADLPVACHIRIYAGGVQLDNDTGLPSEIGPSLRDDGGDAPDFGWVSVYRVGKPPYALLVTQNSYSGGNADMHMFGLYAERNGKLVHLLQGGGDLIKISGNTIDLASYYLAPGDCHSCGSNEHLMLTIDPAHGHLHYRALTPNAEQAMKFLLQFASSDGVAQMKKEASLADDAMAAEQKRFRDLQGQAAASPLPPPVTATCGDFLRAQAEGAQGDYINYTLAIIQQLDMADAARGCRSGVGNAGAGDVEHGLNRHCPAGVTMSLYEFARSEYGTMRAIAKLGYGDGCR